MDFLTQELRKKIAWHGLALIVAGTGFVFFRNALKKMGAAQKHTAADSEVFTALPNLLSDLNLILPISLLAVLFGVACAFYFQEWLSTTSWIRDFIESQIAFLTGLPSLLYGVLAVVISFSYVDLFTTIGDATVPENMKVAESAPSPFQPAVFYVEVLIFILMVMPVTIKTTQEALGSVATPIRESAYVLGATQWQVLATQVVPLAFPKVLAGGCSAMSRAFAAAAVLITVHIWDPTTGPKGIPDRLMVFFGGALVLSSISGILTEMSDSTPTRHE